MAPPRLCHCGKSSCFTCRRRIVNERYRNTHREEPKPILVEGNRYCGQCGGGKLNSIHQRGTHAR